MKNIVLTQEQLNNLVKIIKEDNINEDSMAKKQLFTIATLAHKMWESMEDNQELEDWQESKIAQCEQSIISIAKEYFYDEFVDGDDFVGGMDKLSYDDLIIGKK